MASLLTQIVRRQTLMMVPRRTETVLLVAGPPVGKVTNKDRMIALALFLAVPMIYPIYCMANLQTYNGSNRTLGGKKKVKSDKK